VAAVSLLTVVGLGVELLAGPEWERLSELAVSVLGNLGRYRPKAAHLRV